MFHEAGLAAARRTFQQDRQAGFVRGLEDLHLVSYREVVGLFIQICEICCFAHAGVKISLPLR